MIYVSRYLKGIEIEDDFNNEEDIREYRKTNDISIKKRIATNNVPFVLSVASKYFHFGIPKDDVISFGYIGLMRAIDKFDLDSGWKFTTFAHEVIEKSILNNMALEYGNNSKYFGAYIRKYRQYFYKLYGSFEYMYDEKCMNDTIDCMIEDGIIEEAQRKSLIVGISLMNTYGEYNKEIENVVYEDERPVSIEHEYIKNNLDRILSVLDDDLKEIILYKYGFIDDKIYTLREIADMRNVSYQAVGQKAEKALKKMRTTVKIIK